MRYGCQAYRRSTIANREVVLLTFAMHTKRFPRRRWMDGIDVLTLPQWFSTACRWGPCRFRRATLMTQTKTPDVLLDHDRPDPQRFRRAGLWLRNVLGVIRA